MRYLQRLRSADVGRSVICYAAHTCGNPNRTQLWEQGWGLMCSVAYRAYDSVDAQGRLWRPLAHGGHGITLDNGAFTHWRAGTPFDEMAFVDAVLNNGPYDFVVVPDVVMDAEGTRAMARRWLKWTAARAWAPRVLLPVQNGMEHDVLPLGPRIGVFIGGDDQWKESTIHHWRKITSAAGAYCHVGRVNTERRLALCSAYAVDSIDGSGAAIFSKHAVKMERWRKEQAAQKRMW